MSRWTINRSTGLDARTAEAWACGSTRSPWSPIVSAASLAVTSLTPDWK